jgi:hypothetical protein
MSCENKEYEKSNTIVGEIPTIDFIFFLIFCLIKWAFSQVMK